MVTQLVSHSLGQPGGHPISQSLSGSARWSPNQSVTQWVSEVVTQSVSHSVGQPGGHPISQSLSGSVRWSPNQPANQWVSQVVAQTVNLSVGTLGSATYKAYSVQNLTGYLYISVSLTLAYILDIDIYLIVKLTKRSVSKLAHYTLIHFPWLPWLPTFQL